MINLNQASIAETGETVAIKKVYQDKRYKNRELQIMKELYHTNVIALRHAFYTQGDKVSNQIISKQIDIFTIKVNKNCQCSN